MKDRFQYRVVMQKLLFFVTLVGGVLFVLNTVPGEAFFTQSTQVLMSESNTTAWRKHLSHRPESLVETIIPPHAIECSWLGRRVISLLKREDVDTAQTFNRFYLMFGCPITHLGKVFGCVVDLETEYEDVEEHIRQCWLDPHYSRVPPPASPKTGKH